MKTYSEKLKDPRWQRKRLKIMERDGFSCQHCGSDIKTLHVHHWSYKGDPWDAEFDELQTLCEECHSIAEKCINGLKSIFGGDLLEILKLALRWALVKNMNEPSVIRLEDVDTLIFTSIKTDKSNRVNEIINRLQTKIENWDSDNT